MVVAWLLLVPQAALADGPVLVPQVGSLYEVVAVSPDGRTVATCDWGGCLHLWDADTGALRRSFRVGQREATGIAIDPQGTLVATVDRQGTVAVWEIASGTAVDTFEIEDEGVVAFSPDGRLLAAGSGHSQVWLRDLETGATRELSRVRGMPIRLLFSPDGLSLAVTTGNSMVVLDMATGQTVDSVEATGMALGPVGFIGGDRPVALGVQQVVSVWDRQAGEEKAAVAVGGFEAVALSADSRLLAIGYARGRIALVDVASGERLGDWTAHETRIGALDFSPDGSLLASAGYDNTAALWGLPEGLLQQRFGDFRSWVRFVRFSPDGSKLVASQSGGSDPAFVYDVQTGERLLDLSESGLTGVAFMPDGEHLIVGEANGMSLRSLATGQCLWRLSTQRQEVSLPVLSPDGGLLAARLGSGGGVQLCDAATGEALWKLNPYGGWVSDLRFEDDGRTLLGASSGEWSCRWEMGSGQRLEAPVFPEARFGALSADGGSVAMVADQMVIVGREGVGELRVLEGRLRSVEGTALSADGRRALAGRPDGSALLWDATTGRRIAVLEGHDHYIESAAFDAQGRLAATVGQQGILWETDTGKQLHALESRRASVASVALSPDGRWLASSQGDGTVNLWDLSRGERVHRWAGGALRAGLLAFSPDGTLLAGPSGMNAVVLVDVATLKPVRTLTGPTRVGGALVFSPDGTRLAVGGYPGATVWDVASGRELFTVEGHSKHMLSHTLAGVSAISFSPDGRSIATGGMGPDVLIRDAMTGQEVSRFTPPEAKGQDAWVAGDVTALAFEPDGTHLLVARSRQVEMLDVATGQPVLTLPESQGELTCMVYDPERGNLLTAGSEGAVTVWGAATDRRVSVLEGHLGEVRAMALSADGARLATGGGEGLVRLWSMADKTCIASLWSIPGPREKVYPSGGGSTSRQLPGDSWAAWTEDGYYTCSPGAEPWLWFRDPEDRMHPCSDYEDTLRSPDRVREALSEVHP